MKFSVRSIFICSLIVAVIVIKVSNCQQSNLKYELNPKYVHFSEKDLNLSVCQSGDYYIISQILAYYVAYATKYLGLAFGTNCPVGITAAYTFPHIKGSNTFFWKKTTGTIQMIFVNDELEFLIKFLNTCDVEKTFNELIGANGAAMTTETVLFAESFKDILVNFLDQRNEKELFLNLNGIVVYHEIFQDMAIKLDPQTSPLGGLVYVKSPEEFLDIIEFRSAIVRSLHENLYTDWQHGDEAKNDYGYLKYAYGCSDLLYTLPDDIHTIFIEAGQPNHHTDKFNCVANVVEFMNGKSTALSQEGIRSLGINVQIAFGPVQLSISFNPSFGSSGQSTIGGSGMWTQSTLP